MRVYQAGPLFSEAEILWHRAFRDKLAAADIRVLWPGEFFTQHEIETWGPDAPKQIMERDRAAIDTCDAVVALLDGAQVDDGTAWEIGYAYAKGIPIIGIRTDFRRSGDTAHSCVNAMIEGSCAAIVKDADAVILLLKDITQ
ncbi:MAG: nucleoside 2-deoxyribosyltransferase [Desulfovibrio desulfuricans]|nr:nucleoside 2-deoxyribosyltransferase [Desulfovibrio desulfuricans]